MTGGMSVALKNILNAMYSRDLSMKVKTANEKAFTHVPKKHVKRKKLSPLLFPYCDRYMSFGGGRHLNYRCSQLSHTGISECKQSKIKRELLENLLLNCTREMVNFVSATLKCRKKQWSESCMLSEEIEAL